MDFFQFLGSYWWLAFPLMGALGGVGSAWERSAKRRHKRRLEILEAKREMKAVEIAARQRPEPETPTAAAHAASAADLLARTEAEHDAITARWLEYELDVAKMIAYPAMSDGRQPLTAGFLRAKKVADRLRPPASGPAPTPQELAAYQNAVTDYEVAFELAERDARRLKDSSFTAPERKRLDVAKQLLTVAVDEAATPAERQLAYKRVREELDGLISLSDGAIDVLERKVALELPASERPPLPPPSAPRASPGSAPEPHDPPHPEQLPPERG
ncbi:hypothetical protein [Microbacterium caowuchunii]|uniref:Uncharacterized protein n=1 Tax=Microbacterium caowuchunii TaxID=2614638 RepID=A0A5N0TK87_9MICO|nr:hypothetical protein F6B40_07255 [Microbacterium caowuchunii]